jgi:hypothetical protein
MFSYQDDKVKEVSESIRHYRLQKENHLPKTIFISGQWDSKRMVRNFICEEFPGMEISEQKIWTYFFV